MTSKTTTDVKILADLLTLNGKERYSLLPMTLMLEGDMLTVGTLGGPDMWRGKLSDLRENTND